MPTRPEWSAASPSAQARSDAIWGMRMTVLAYTGIVTPQAVPTTLVLDSEGRVSARILGRFEPGILKALIKTALKETVN